MFLPILAFPLFLTQWISLPSRHYGQHACSSPLIYSSLVETIFLNIKTVCYVVYTISLAVQTVCLAIQTVWQLQNVNLVTDSLDCLDRCLNIVRSQIICWCLDSQTDCLDCFICCLHCLAEGVYAGHLTVQTVCLFIYTIYQVLEMLKEMSGQ